MRDVASEELSKQLKVTSQLSMLTAYACAWVASTSSGLLRKLQDVAPKAEARCRRVCKH